MSRSLTFIIAHVLFLTLALFHAPSFGQNTLTTKINDRIALVLEQIKLLQNRLQQANTELSALQAQHEERFSEISFEKIGKNLLEKSQLEVTLAKTNLDSVNIEYNDSQQSINWLEKNIQEIENQLNVLNMFGLKIAPSEQATVKEYLINLEYQKNLLQLEKTRVKYLYRLCKEKQNIWQIKLDNLNRLRTTLRTKRMSMVREQQVQDELTYQELQNYWLNQLNKLNEQIAKVDPVKFKAKHAEYEQSIFLANENANYAYIQSLMARYKDQIRQMNLTGKKGSSISVLNEIRDQAQLFTKQINKLVLVIKERMGVVEGSLAYLKNKNVLSPAIKGYMQKLNELEKKYQQADLDSISLSHELNHLRQSLDQALQNELSARQGFPAFSVKSFMDLGREFLLIPALTFQIVKNLTNHFYEVLQGMAWVSWILFLVIELVVMFAYFFLRNLLVVIIHYPSMQENFNVRWLMLEWVRRNFLGLVLITNILVVMRIFDVSPQHINTFFYLACVWLTFKGMLTIARLCLVETTHDSAGYDVKLYYRLKWIILIGGVITALTVFVNQLPLIYEVKILCDRLFLLFLLIISLLLLRSWDVIPKLILSNMDTKHPYLQKSVCLIGILVPVLIFANAFIGLLGYVNLIMTISRYEGIFLLVLFAYLILRGFLSDGMEHLSRLMIQYVNNGWLWTEAFLKPLDKVLRVSLFLVAWAVLFLLYGWDQQSPIVERLTRLLNYEVASMLNASITPLRMIELFVVISIFYWSAKWTREFVYRLLITRTQDMGIRNSIAILSQYSVIVMGGLLCLRVLGIDLGALAVVFGVFAFGIGWGLRDLANNFACGFLILLERPLRVGDIVDINNIEGEVIHIGSRAVTVRTWDHMELVVPNAEIFNKSFTNWTAKDNIIRSVLTIKISRFDNPHEIRTIIQNILANHKEVLKDPPYDVYLREMSDNFMAIEIRYYVNIRQVKSRSYVTSLVLMQIWDEFAKLGIEPPYPQQEVILRNQRPSMNLPEIKY